MVDLPYLAPHGGAAGNDLIHDIFSSISLFVGSKQVVWTKPYYVITKMSDLF